MRVTASGVFFMQKYLQKLCTSAGFCFIIELAARISAAKRSCIAAQKVCTLAAKCVIIKMYLKGTKPNQVNGKVETNMEIKISKQQLEAIANGMVNALNEMLGYNVEKKPNSQGGFDILGSFAYIAIMMDENAVVSESDLRYMVKNMAIVSKNIETKSFQLMSDFLNKMNLIIE